MYNLSIGTQDIIKPANLIKASFRYSWLSYFLSLFAFVVIFLKPNPESRDWIRIADLSIVLIGVLLLFPLILQYRFVKPYSRNLLFLTIFIIGSMLITFIHGTCILDISYTNRDYRELYRPFLYLCMLLLGYNCKAITQKGIFRFILIILLLEISLGVLQLYNVANINNSPIRFIYGTHRIRADLGRITGTLGNSNEYGMMLNMLLFYLLFYPAFKINSFTRIVTFMFFHLGVIFLSSSRGALLAGVLLYCLGGIKYFYLLNSRLKWLLLILVLFVLSVSVKYAINATEYLKPFAYMYTTLKYLQSKQSLSQMGGIALRKEHHDKLISNFKKSPLLGVGPNKQTTNVGDNDYVYTLFLWGIFGTIFKYGFFLYLSFLLYCMAKQKDLPLAKAGLIFMAALAVNGIFADSFNNLKYIPMFLLLCGYTFRQNDDLRLI